MNSNLQLELRLSSFAGITFGRVFHVPFKLFYFFMLLQNSGIGRISEDFDAGLTLDTLIFPTTDFRIKF